MPSNVSNMRANIDVSLTMDQGSVQKLQRQLADLRVNTKLGNININDEGIKKALTSVKELQSALNASYSIHLNGYDLNKFTNVLSKSGNSISKMSKEFNQLGLKGQSAFASLSRTILSSQSIMEKHQNFLQRYAQTFMSAAYWGAAYKAINSVSDSIRNAYQYTVDLDTSLNNIRIVTEKSSNEMERFARSANKAAQSLGVSTKAYTDASLLFYEQGLNDKQVKTRSDVTMKVSNVTGMGAAEAAENLTAVWNGFQVTTENAEKVVDQLAAVAANSASNLEELSTAMSKVASSANSMGVSSEQLTAQIATIEEATRQAPESIGTALKTVFARLGDLKVDGVDEFGTSLGEVSSQLKQMGIDVVDQYGNMREMGTVIEEVAAKWDTWSSAQKQAAAIAMAGKRQYNNLFALFENWDRYTENLEIAQNSLGTLSKQQDIFLESTEGKLKQVRAKLEEFYSHLLDSKKINTAISGLDVLITQLNTLTRNPFGKLTTGFYAINKLLNGSISSGLANILSANTQLDAKVRQRVVLEETIKRTEEQILNLNAQENLFSSKQNAARISSVMASKEQASLVKESLAIRENLTAEMQRELTLQEEAIAAEKEKIGIQLQKIHSEGLNAPSLNVVKDEYISGKLNANSQGFTALKKESEQIKQNLMDTKKYVDSLNKFYLKSNKSKNQINSLETLKQQNLLTQEQLQEIEKIAKGEKDIEVRKQKIVEYLNKEVVKTSDLITEVEHLENLMNELDAKSKAYHDNLILEGINADMERRFSNLMSGFGSVVMGFNGLSSIWSAFTSEDLSTWEKFEQILISASFTLPMFFSGVMSLKDVLTNVTLTQRTLNTLMEAGVDKTTAKTLAVNLLNTAEKAEMQTQLKNIGVENADSVALKINAMRQSTLSQAILRRVASLEALKIAEFDATTGLYTLTKGATIGLGVFTALAVGIATIGAAIYSYKKAQEELDNRISRAEGIYQKRVELLKSLKEAYDNVKQSVDSFKDEKSKIEDMVIGTKEWKDAVRDLNLEVIELIANNKDLAEVYEKNSAGMYEINEDKLNEYYEKQQKTIDTQVAMTSWAKADVDKANLEKVKKSQILSQLPERRKLAYGIGQIGVPFIGGNLGGLIPLYGASLDGGLNPLYDIFHGIDLDSGISTKDYISDLKDGNIEGLANKIVVDTVRNFIRDWGGGLLHFSNGLDEEMEIIAKSLDNVNLIKNEKDLKDFTRLEEATNKYAENLKTAYEQVLPILSNSWSKLDETQQDLYSEVLSYETAQLRQLNFAEGNFDRFGLYEEVEDIEHFSGLKVASLRKDALKKELERIFSKELNEDVKLNKDVENWLDDLNEFNLSSVLTDLFNQKITAEQDKDDKNTINFVTESGFAVEQVKSEEEAKELLSSYTLMFVAQLQYGKNLFESISKLNEEEMTAAKGIIYSAKHQSDKIKFEEKEISNVEDLNDAIKNGLITKKEVIKLLSKDSNIKFFEDLNKFDVDGLQGENEVAKKDLEKIQNKIGKETIKKASEDYLGSISDMLSMYGEFTAASLEDFIPKIEDEKTALKKRLQEATLEGEDVVNDYIENADEALEKLNENYEHLYEKSYKEIQDAFDTFREGLTFSEMEYSTKFFDKATGIEDENKRESYLNVVSNVTDNEQKIKLINVLGNIDYSKYLHLEDFKSTLEEAGVILGDALPDDKLKSFVNTANELDLSLKLLNNTTDALIKSMASFKSISKDLKTGKIVSKDDYEDFINNLSDTTDKQKVAALFAKTVNGQYMFIGEDVSELKAVSGMSGTDIEKRMNQIEDANTTYKSIFADTDNPEALKLTKEFISGQYNGVYKEGAEFFKDYFGSEDSIMMEILKKIAPDNTAVKTLENYVGKDLSKDENGQAAVQKALSEIIPLLSQIITIGEGGGYEAERAVTMQGMSYAGIRGYATKVDANGNPIDEKDYEGFTADGMSSANEKASAVVFNETMEALDSTSAEWLVYKKSVEDAMKAQGMTEDTIVSTTQSLFTMRKGITSLSKIWNSTYKDAKKGSEEWYEAINETLPIVRTMFNDVESIDLEFIIDNLSTIQKAAEGDKKAIKELQDKVAKQIVLDVNSEKMTDDIKNKAIQAIQEVNDKDFKIGAEINVEEEGWKEAFNNFLKAGNYTAETASEWFASVGIIVKGLIENTDELNNKFVQIGEGTTFKADGSSSFDFKQDSKSGEGSSKSSSASHNFEKIEKKEIDLYYKVNNQLEKTNRILDRIADNAENLVGNQAIKNLEQQNKQLEKAIKLDDKKLKINKKDLADRKGQLIADFGVTFNKSGYVTNADVIDKNFNAREKSLKTKYNKMSAEAQESKAGLRLKKQIDLLELEKEGWDNQLSGYEESLDIWYETQEDKHEKQQQIYANNLEKLEKKLSEKTILGDLKRSFLEFDKSVNIASKDYNSLAKIHVKEAKSRAAEIKANADGIATLQKNLDEMIAKGKGPAFGNQAAQTREKLFELINEQQDALKAMHESEMAVVEDLGNNFSEMVSNLDRVNTQFENIYSDINHYSDITKLLLGEDNFKAQEQFFKQRDVLNKNEIQAIQKNLKYYKDQRLIVESQIAEATNDQLKQELEDQLNTIDDQITSENQKLQSTITRTFENIIDGYKNSVKKVYDELGKAMMGGFSFSTIESGLKKTKEYNDAWLDDVQRIYETEKLASQFDDLYNQTTSLEIQNQIVEAKKQELEYLESIDKLSQYDIDRANAKLNLLMKEIALREAQENKSKLRLRRDAQGNYSYQYTANEADTGKAKQELEDARFNLNKLDQDELIKIQERIFALEKEVNEELKTVDEDIYLSDEERQQKRKTIMDKYEEDIQHEWELYDRALERTYESSLPYYNKINKTAFDNINEMTSEEKNKFHDFIFGAEGLVPLNANGFDLMSKKSEDWKDKVNTSITQVESYFDTYKEKMDEVAELAGEDYSLILNGDGEDIPGLKDVATETENLKTKTDELGTAYINTSTEISNTLTNLKAFEEELRTTDYTAQIKKLGDLASAYENVKVKQDKVKNPSSKSNKKTKTDYSSQLDNTAYKPTSNGNNGSANENNGGNPKEEPIVPPPDPNPDNGKKKYEEVIDDIANNGILGKGDTATLGKKTKLKDELITGFWAYKTKKDAINQNTKNAKWIWQYKDPKLGGNKDWEYLGSKISQVKVSKARDKAIEIEYGSNVGRGQGWPMREDPLRKTWLNRSDFEDKFYGYDTGGYTGAWGNKSGKIAMLHEKELVLNKEDTSNMLKSIGLLRDMLKGNSLEIISNALDRTVNNLNSMTRGYSLNRDNSMNQNITIHADFPNVTTRDEIEAAFASLENKAAQYAWSNKLNV